MQGQWIVHTNILFENKYPGHDLRGVQQVIRSFITIGDKLGENDRVVLDQYIAMLLLCGISTHTETQGAVTFEQGTLVQQEPLICEVCSKLVPDRKVCDACGDALCEEHRCDDDGIVFCFECFQERQEEYNREEEFDAVQT